MRNLSFRGTIPRNINRAVLLCSKLPESTASLSSSVHLYLKLINMASDPPPPKHNFQFQKLAYSEPRKVQNYVKASTYFNKRADISYEQFHQIWYHVHGDLITSMKSFRDLGVLRYSQFIQ